MMRVMLTNKLILSLLLALSAGSYYPYHQLLVGRFFIALVLWGAIKSLQLRPSIVADGHYQYLVILTALGVDAAIVHHCWRSMSLSDLVLSGASLSAPLLALRAARRIGVIAPKFSKERRTSFDPSNQKLSGHSQNLDLSTLDPCNQRLFNHTGSESDRQSVLSILTKTPVSTLLIAQPGSGKTMTASSMGRQWVRDGHHVYYIDSKMDEKEINLWDDACSERYQFDGTLLLNPNDECERLLEAFEAFEEFRLRHLGDGKQTICILDELPAVMAVFKTYKPSPNAVLNFINRIVNRLPSRNCHILAVTQNPSCADTLPTGTLGTLKKIIIAKAGSEAELEEWKGLTVMKPIDLSGVSSAIRNSPVDRACYYSVLQKWLPMESLIRKGDYNRDTLSGGNFQSSDQREYATAATAAPPSPLPPLDSLILDYFAAANPDRAKSIKNLRDSSRLRDRASDTELIDSLDRLTSTGHLMRMSDGWVLPDWIDRN
jgi:hypothetical protein